MNKPLNTRQKKFVDNYVIKGLSIAESVRRAGYSIKSGKSEDAGSYGCKLLRQDRVKAYLNKLREKQFSETALSVGEKRAYLARAVRCDVTNPDADLIQEVSETSNDNGVSRKVKVVDKLRAIELDSKIAGDFYDDRQAQVSNPFLLIVSLGKTGSVSQELSATNQAKLTNTSPIIEAELVS
jgi:phage terminase small subunit